MATPRFMINQVFQLGAENIGDPGVGGAANQRLGTFNSQIAPVASGAFGVFRPSAGKYVGQVVPTDIYSEGPFTDTIDFNTVPFLFAGNVGWVLATAASGVSTWRHTPIPFGGGSQRSYKVQEGEDTVGAVPGAAYNYSSVVMPDLNLRFMRTGASQIGGRVLGKKLDPGITLTSPTSRAGRSISGLATGVWEAPNWAALTSAPARLAPVALDIAFRHNNVFAPWFALDDSIQSFAGFGEQAIDAGIQISVLADVDTDDISGVFNYGNMEDGESIFLKILNIGPLISGAAHFSIEIDLVGEISGPPRRANVGPLRVWQWDALLKPPEVTPFLPFDITVINTLPPAAIPTLP
jgi:hypothetical protein